MNQYQENFCNQSSHCLFIGDRNLKDVIETDKQELVEFSGSFEAIADRMQQMVDYAEKQNTERTGVSRNEWEKVITPVIEQYQLKYGDDWHKNPGIWGKYGDDWAKLRAQFKETWLDEKVAVLMGFNTRGFQLCPFGCRKTWNDDVEVYSRKTGRRLTVNRGTVHLAREHHLLEKDNEYGISAEEFYKKFM